MRRVVVIGASAAGSAAAEAIRRHDPACRLTLISDEPIPLYSRCLISEYLVGRVGRDRLAFQRPGWPSGLEVEVVQDRALEVDPRAGEVRTAGGRRLGYDGLLLATGAEGISPPIPGIEAEGVAVPYQLDQAQAALVSLNRAGEVVVLGAGKVGVKAVEAAAVRGRRVTLVEQAPYPLPGTLDEKGGELVRRLLEAHGVRVRTGVTAVEVLVRGGAVRGLVLSTGEQIACQALVVAIGVRPRAELALQAGAEVGDGVIVDRAMKTSLEGVFAAGDVAETAVLHGHERAVLANWLNAVQQGRVAGANLAGAGEAYPGGIRANAFRLWDHPVVSIGEVGGGEKKICDEKSGAYRKLTFVGSRLVGVMQVGGEIRDVGVLSSVIKSGKPIDDPQLLLGSGFASLASPGPRLSVAAGAR